MKTAAFQLMFVYFALAGISARAADSIQWGDGLYKSWSCRVTNPSAIRESPSQLDLYTLQEGNQSSPGHFSFRAFVVLRFERAELDPSDPWRSPITQTRNAIAFEGLMSKDESVTENGFTFDVLDQPVHLTWRGTNGQLLYEGQSAPVECRYPVQQPVLWH